MPLSANQCAFLAAFSSLGNVTLAAQAAGIGRRTHYEWQNQDSNAGEQMPLKPYLSIPSEQLVGIELKILNTQYSSLDEIDSHFFGDEFQAREPRDARIKSWCKSFSTQQLKEVNAKFTFGLRRRRYPFPKAEFRRQIVATFGGISAVMILYYLVIAIYWWRKLRGEE